MKLGLACCLALVLLLLARALGSAEGRPVGKGMKDTDQFSVYRLDGWAIPARLSESRSDELAPKAGEKGRRTLKFSWVVPRRVAAVVVPPGEDAGYTFNVSVGNDFEEKEFRLASGKLKRVELSSTTARNGAGLTIAGKVKTTSESKQVIFLQQRVQEIDEKGGILNTWYTPLVSWQVLVKAKVAKP